MIHFLKNISILRIGDLPKPVREAGGGQRAGAGEGGETWGCRCDTPGRKRAGGLKQNVSDCGAPQV